MRNLSKFIMLIAVLQLPGTALFAAIGHFPFSVRKTAGRRDTLQVKDERMDSASSRSEGQPTKNDLPVFDKTTRIKPAGTLVKGTSATAPGSFNDFTGGTLINSGNQLQLSWAGIPGATEYDIEWTTADAGNDNYSTISQMAAGTSGTVAPAVLNSIFLHNSTRITTVNLSYLLSLVYNDDFVLVRLRQVQYSLDGVRLLGDWDYQLASGHYAAWALNWYQENLNWQYSAAFAEEGKKKEVVSYFDGSLRSRQTVTLNNSDNVAVVQENLYDEFGRATASILPAPFKEASGVTPFLRYFPNYNRNSSNTPYNFMNVSGTTPSAGCEYNPDSLNVSSGASMYYSSSNPFIGDKLFDAYIPDGQGYPISVTEYTADNTGRIKVQGGVGKALQPGRAYPSNTTKYFYAKPEQWELDRVFGNDVGDASHYLKNMAVDPNGQISISYVNASGKTVATALSGNAPANMDSISTILPAKIEKISLLDSAQFIFDSSALNIKGTTTYLVSQSGPASMTYSIQKLIDHYPGGAQAICSNCYYDLTIKVLNDCNTPIYTTTTPVQVGSKTGDCGGAGIQSDSLRINFPEIGEYYFTYELAFSKTVMENYVTQFVSQGLTNGYLHNEFSFILPYLDSLNYKSCLSDCSTCEQTLGARTDFIQAFKTKLLALDVDSASVASTSFQTWVDNKYTTLKAYCDSLSATCTLPAADSTSNCEQYETPMLADVSPGGQYALFDPAGNPVEPALNVISNNWRTAFPVLSPSSPQYQAELITLPDGTVTSPYDASFTLAMLVQYWKADWASRFLMYHPEFCKLQFCYTNNASETWDGIVQDNINQAAAIPTIPGAPAGLHYDYTNAAWLVAADPFFQSGGLGASYSSAMQADLQNYTANVLKVTTATTKSLTGFIDFLTYCSDPNVNTATQLNSFNNWDGCAPVASCRVPDKEWNSYKELYFGLKQVYYNKVRAATTCMNSCPVGMPQTLPGVSPCPAVTDFTVTDYSTVNGQPGAACADTMKMVAIAYTGGKTRTNVSVTIAYPSGVNTAGLPTVFAFAPGDSSKIFCIPQLIPSQGIAVQSLVCPDCQANPLLFTTWKNDHILQNLYDTTGHIISTNTLTPADSSYTNGRLTIKPDNTFDITGTCDPRSGSWDLDSNCLFAVYDNDIKYSLDSISTSKLILKHKEGLLEEIWYLNGVGVICASPVTIEVAGVAGSNSYFTGTFPARHTLTLVAGTAGTVPPFTCTDSGGGTGPSTSAFYTCLKIHTAANLSVTYSNVWAFDCVYDNLPSSCPAVLLTKVSRFDDQNAPLTVADTASLIQQNKDALAQQIQSSASSGADGWIADLTPGLNSYSSATISNLRAALVEIATKGGDLNHSFGASSVAPGQTTTSGYLNFTTAIKGILGLGNFTSQLNPWLISAPYPYAPAMQDSFYTITESSPALCSLLQQFQTQCDTYNAGHGTSLNLYSYLTLIYGSAMSMNSTDFTALQNSCGSCKYLLDSTLTLPVFLNPGAKGCVVPADYSTAKADLNTQFGGSLSNTDPNYETIFTNFMNQRWGFVLGYTQYLDYEAALVTNPSAILCNQVQGGITPDPLGCIETQIAVGVANGKRDYAAYIEVQKNLFRASYVSTCSAAKSQVNLYAPEKIYHYTLYYYDQADNLLSTVPPEGVQLLTDAQITASDVYRTQFEALDSLTTATPVYPAHRLFTTYAYNSTNQVNQQQSPDGGTNRYWYDLLSRLVVSQNDKQLPAHNYSYTVFDPIGRITEVGQKNQTTVNLHTPDYLDTATVHSFYIAGSNAQITNTYYDQPAPVANGIMSVAQGNLRKRVAASTLRDTGTGLVQQATYYDYDLDGNVKTLYQQIAGLGLKRIDYEYDLVSGKVNFVSYQNGRADQFYYKYIYDADNRLTQAWTGTLATIQPNGGSTLLNGKLDATYQYYLHGPLARIELAIPAKRCRGLTMPTLCKAG